MTTPTAPLAQRALVAEQLDLFANVGDTAVPRGIPRALARASVSPGWWPFVAPLFEEDADTVVVACREEDGRLVLELEALGPEHDSIEPAVRRIRQTTARICGCCGKAGAHRVRLDLDSPTRCVCPRCEARLRAGEEYLAIADEFWRLDGSRRPPASPARAAVQTAVPVSAARPCATLAPDELRDVVREMRVRMASQVVGHHHAVARLALLAGLHVGGGLTRGGRALMVGPSGAGKTTLMAALRHALEPWALPWVEVDAISITSPGWSGAPTIGGLIEEALGGRAPESDAARHAVIVVDELHHVGIVRGTHGNMEAKRREVLASLLGLAGYGTVLLGEGSKPWSSREALVIGLGAFTELLDTTRPFTTADIVRAGIPLELTTRLAEEVIVLRQLREPELIELLRRWPALASLKEICMRLGHAVRITDEAYARAARVIALGHDRSTARTAGGWLVSALRRALMAALDRPHASELVITPDSLPIPPNATRPGPQEDPPEDNEPDVRVY